MNFPVPSQILGRFLHTERSRRNLYGAATVLSVFVAIGLSILALGDQAVLFAATGMWALSIVLLPPALLPRYDLFSTWSFVILTVAIGLTLRGFYISFDYPDTDRIQGLFLLGQDPSFFAKPAVVLLTGLACLTGGFLFTWKRHSQSTTPPFSGRRSETSSRWLYGLSIVILLVSLTSSLLYIRLTGGLESGLLSAKRTPIPSLDLGSSGYQSYGTLRFLGGLAIYAHLLVLGESLRPTSNRRIWKGTLAVLLLLTACVIPFYASLRSTVALNLCLSAAMFHFSGRKRSLPRLAALGGAVILMMSVMTILRSERDNAAAFSRLPSAPEALNAVVLNRNQIELAKTAHILHAVPDELGFRYGQTIWIWLAAPVPRALWPDKPIIPPGPIIGHQIYGQAVAGVPPALVAELFWNFSLPGVLLGGFLFGTGLRWLEKNFLPVHGGETWRAALYVAGPMTLGFNAVGSSLGYGLFQMTLHLAVMSALVWLTRERRSGWRSGRHLSGSEPDSA